MPRHHDQLYKCRVCGFPQADPPWGLDGRTPSFDICACCGVEFGYEDATAEGVERYRQEWLDSRGSCKGLNIQVPPDV